VEVNTSRSYHNINKHPSQKKNRSKRSPGSENIEVLKSAIFRVFSTDDGVFFILFYFISVSRNGVREVKL
jgi:hypothetical protein